MKPRENNQLLDERSRVVRIRDFVAVVISVGTVAGFVAYLVLRHMYAEFLDELNIRPEDLGLDYFEILTSSTGALLVGLGIPALTVTCAVYLATQSGPPWPLLLLIAVANTVAILKVGPTLLGIMALVLIFWCAVPIPRLPRPPRVSSFRTLALVTTLLAAGISVVQIFTLAEQSGRATRVGLATKEFTEFGMPFIGIQPTAATLRWADSNNPGNSLLPTCPMYIGEHAGTLFLFDVLRHETLRIPASRVVVRIPPRPRDQQLDRCFRERLEEELGSVKNRELGSCLQEELPPGQATPSNRRLRRCSREQLEQKLGGFKDQRLGQCLQRSIRTDPLEVDDMQAKGCFLGFAERVVKRKIGKVGVGNIEDLRRCLRGTIETDPWAVHRRRLERCVGEAVKTKRSQ